MPGKVRVASLFSGIGVFDKGAEWAGCRIVWQCEVNEFRQNALRKHWPGVPCYTDIRYLSPYGAVAPDGGLTMEWPHGQEKVDILIGGFPCQDISGAGKGAGIAGSRSRLWFEMLRIIRLLRPRWVVAENVPALRTRGADVVLAGLEEAGYTCWPLVVGAEHIGASQRRIRVYIVARLADADGHWKHKPGGYHPKSRGRIGDCRWPARPGEPQHDWEEPRLVSKSSLGASIDGDARRLARWRRAALRAIGDSGVPEVLEVIVRAIKSTERAIIQATSGKRTRRPSKKQKKKAKRCILRRRTVENGAE